jgi:hypothetical protein
VRGCERFFKHRMFQMQKADHATARKIEAALNEFHECSALVSAPWLMVEGRTAAEYPAQRSR